MDKFKQFLADEKELLTDLALDVVNASYSVQMTRISGVIDTMAMFQEK